MQAISLFSVSLQFRILAIFDHFGYPSPQLDQWQQHIWYDLGATQDLLHHMRNCLAKGLPAAASPPRVEPPSSPTFQLLCRLILHMEESSLRL